MFYLIRYLLEDQSTGLGFTRMCASLSRTGVGLLIVGDDINKSKLPWPLTGRNAWMKLTNGHRTHGEVMNENASGLDAMMEELHLPGSLYER